MRYLRDGRSDPTLLGADRPALASVTIEVKLLISEGGIAARRNTRDAFEMIKSVKS